MQNQFIFKIAMLLAVVVTACTSATKSEKKLVWVDEFDYQGLPDSTKWNYESGYVRNGEMQYYMPNRLENARVENGNLVITALKDSMVIGNDTVRVSSASVITKGKQDFTYGRIEVRAKIPVFLGSWPAIWLLGSNIDEVGWPMCGEIDMMENVGYDPDTVHFNIHTKAYNHSIKTNKGQKAYLSSSRNDFHIYALEWSSEKLDFFLDNKLVFTFANEKKGVEVWPYDKAQYLILNLAVGGAWGGSKGVDLSAFPQQMLIDYVRIYQ
jgi:beta-glucanase (GH16 family)